MTAAIAVVAAGLAASALVLAIAALTHLTRTTPRYRREDHR